MLIDSLLKAVFILSFLSIVSSDIPICLTWRRHNNWLQFVCRVNKRHLPVIFIDPANDELARCYFVGTQYNCFNHVSEDDFKQTPSTNEIVFSVKSNLYSNIIGNWTCRHGTLGDEASVEVDICNNRVQADHKSPVLNVFAWTFAGFGTVFWIIELLAVFMHYRDKNYSTLIKWIDRYVIDTSNDRTVHFRKMVFLMLTALIGIGIVISRVKQQEDTIQGQAMCVMIGIVFAVFVYVFGVSAKEGQRSLSKAQLDDSKLPLTVVTESEDESKQSQDRICCGEAKDHGGDIVVLGNEKEVDVFIHSLNRITESFSYCTVARGDKQNTQLDYLLKKYAFVFILFTENLKVDSLGFTRGDIDNIQCMGLYPKIKIICKCRRDVVIRALGRIDLDFQNNRWDDFMKPDSKLHHILRQLPIFKGEKEGVTSKEPSNDSGTF